MLYYALVFFVIALVSGVFGFGGIAGASSGFAQMLFLIFILALAVSIVIGMVRRPHS